MIKCYMVKWVNPTGFGTKMFFVNELKDCIEFCQKLEKYNEVYEIYAVKDVPLTLNELKLG